MDKNISEEETPEDTSRKRSGDCLDADLPPSLMAKCDPYFCGVCNQEFYSQIISNAHYAGRPHEQNVQQEIVRMGFRSPKRKKLQVKKSNTIKCDLCNIFVSSEETLNSHKLGKEHGKKLKLKLKLMELKRDVCNIFLNSDDTPIHQKQLQMIEQNKPSHACDLCGIITNGLSNFKAHLQGKSHTKKAKQLSTGQPSKTTNQKKIEVSGDVSNISLKSEEPKEWFNQYDKPLPSSLLEKCTPKFCGVCHVHSPSEVVSKAHYVGKPHEKKVKQELEKIFNGSGEIAPKRKIQSDPKRKIQSDEEKCDPKYCGVCDINFTSLVHSKQHYGGTKHKKKVKLCQNNVEIDSQPKEVMMAKNATSFACGVCEFTSTDNEDLEMHLLLGHSEQQVLPDKSSVAEIIIENKETEGIVNVGLPEVEKEGTPEMKESHSEEKFMSMIDEKTETELGITDSQGISDSSMEQGEISKNTQIDTNLAFKSLEKEEVVVLPENCEVKKSSKDDVTFDDALNSDDDLIILESQDSFPSRNDESINDAPVIESVKLCEYPVGKKDKVNVSTQDYATLEHDTFLNDIIIDFYLLYLVNNVLPIEDRGNVHIFSTMFYKRLLQAPRENAKKVPEYETDDTLTPPEKRHFRVASWTKNVDLFEKDMLIVPICECSHWFLILVVKPGLIFVPAKKAEKTNKGESFVIVLDSVGGTKNYAVKNVRRYLACEWNKKKCSGESSLKDLSSSAAQMRTLRPNKPEQQNNSDCGIYLLHYVEKVFENVSAFLWKSLVTYRTREWFTTEEVGRKRGEIAQLIKGLAAQQRPGEVIEYPSIKFTAESSEEEDPIGSEETEAELEDSIKSEKNETGMNT